MVKVPHFIVKLCRTAITLAVLAAIIFSPHLTSATSGSLRSATIKTCPDGITYGAHGSDLHWHVATRDADGSWSPDGSTIASDPCPGTSGVNHGNYDYSDSSASPSPSSTPTQPSQSFNAPSATVVPPIPSQDSDAADTTEATGDTPSATQPEASASPAAPQEDLNLTVQFAGMDPSYDLSTPDQTVTFRYGINQLFFTVTPTPADAQLVAVYDGEQLIQNGANIAPGEHPLRFVVRDKSGRESSFSITIKRPGLFWTLVLPVLFAGLAYVIAFVVIWAIFLFRRFGQDAAASAKFGQQKGVQRFQRQLILFPISPWFKQRKAVQQKAQLRPFYSVARAATIAWVICASVALIAIVTALVPASAEQLPESSSTTATYVATDTGDATTSSPTEPAVDSTGASSSPEATPDSPQTSPVSAEPPSDAGPMSGIEIAEAANVPYDRYAYQDGWDVGSGCNLRARILQATSIVSVVTSNGCTVTYGSWYDPYTGNTLTGNPYRGDGTANDLDIDHIIPLAYVNAHGGYDWSPSQKKAYGQSLEAYQNGVYVAVSAAENRRKSDSGPSEYYPPNSAYRCEYATKWRDLARIYDLSLSRADYEVVEDVLIECAVP